MSISFKITHLNTRILYIEILAFKIFYLLKKYIFQIDFKIIKLFSSMHNHLKHTVISITNVFLPILKEHEIYHV